jgi:hypothetical protein
MREQVAYPCLAWRHLFIGVHVNSGTLERPGCVPTLERGNNPTPDYAALHPGYGLGAPAGCVLIVPTFQRLVLFSAGCCFPKSPFIRESSACSNAANARTGCVSVFGLWRHLFIGVHVDSGTLERPGCVPTLERGKPIPPRITLRSIQTTGCVIDARVKVLLICARVYFLILHF